MSIVATKRTARQVPGGLFVRFFGPTYQAPREKKPSNASTRTTIRMIQRMLNVPPLALLKQKRPEDRFGYDRKPETAVGGRDPRVGNGRRTGSSLGSEPYCGHTALSHANEMPLSRNPCTGIFTACA